jgi:hypothetical protein
MQLKQRDYCVNQEGGSDEHLMSFEQEEEKMRKKNASQEEQYPLFFHSSLSLATSVKKA